MPIDKIIKEIDEKLDIYYSYHGAFYDGYIQALVDCKQIIKKNTEKTGRCKVCGSPIEAWYSFCGQECYEKSHDL